MVYLPQVTDEVRSLSSRVAAGLRSRLSRPGRVAPAAVPDLPIRDLISGDVTCLSPEMDLDRACDLLLEAGLAGAPVVDEAGRALGVVCLHDLLPAAEDEGEENAAPLVGMTTDGFAYAINEGFQVVGMPRVLVAQVMRRTFPRLSSEATLAEAAQRLSAQNTLPCAVVTEQDGRVVGIVTRGDIARWVSARINGCEGRGAEQHALEQAP